MSSDRNDEFLDNGVSTFTLTDDEGNEYEFELLDFVDLDEDVYKRQQTGFVHSDEPDRRKMIFERAEISFCIRI